MSIDQGLIGHERIYSVLRQIFCARKMGHAYLFSGPRHVGKHTIARALLELLPNKEIIHVDRFVDKEGKKTDSIVISQIRDIISALSLSLPSKESYRIVFFNETEFITKQAQDALLKSLEEPPERTIFFFFEHVSGQLLSTIRSRCSFVRFSLVQDEDIKRAIAKRVSSEEDCEEIVQLSAGRPGIAHTLFSGEALKLLKNRMVNLGMYGEAKFKKEDGEIAELIIHQCIQDIQIRENMYHDALTRYDAFQKIHAYSETHVYQPGLIEAFL